MALNAAMDYLNGHDTWGPAVPAFMAEARRIMANAESASQREAAQQSQAMQQAQLMEKYAPQAQRSQDSGVIPTARHQRRAF